MKEISKSYSHTIIKVSRVDDFYFNEKSKKTSETEPSLLNTI